MEFSVSWGRGKPRLREEAGGVGFKSIAFFISRSVSASSKFASRINLVGRPRISLEVC